MNKNVRSAIILCIGILIGLFLRKFRIISESFLNTSSTTSTGTSNFAKVNFENPGMYNLQNPIFFTRDDFENEGRFGKAEVRRNDSNSPKYDRYFVKVVHSNNKKIMQFGDDTRDLVISSAKINSSLLQDGEKCIVKPREIILLPEDHEHAPIERVEYRVEEA